MKKSRHVPLILVAAALILVIAAAAGADPWPNYSAAGTGYPVFVTSSYDGGTDLWTFNVYLDPAYDLMAFVVYPTGLTSYPSPAQDWDGYVYSNTAGWTDTNGAWEWNRVNSAPSNTSAAFGWLAAPGPTERITGAGFLIPTATFVAQDLPAGVYDLFVVHIYSDATGLTYWAQAGDEPPPNVPEPGAMAASLALLTPGGISALLWRLRRKRG